MESKNLIEQARKIATAKGFNQTRWSAESGHALNGQTVLRILKNGDCRVSTLISLLDVVGCRLVIMDDDSGMAENSQKTAYFSASECVDDQTHTTGLKTWRGGDSNRQERC